MLGIHAASGTLYSLFVLLSLHVPAGACIPVARLLVRLQFMYFQYNVYLSIVVCTNIYIHAHVIQNNLRMQNVSNFGQKAIIENGWQYMNTVPVHVHVHVCAKKHHMRYMTYMYFDKMYYYVCHKKLIILFI